jgi:hypothetical protein
MSNFVNQAATGLALAAPRKVLSITLTAGADAASVAIDDSTDGSGDPVTVNAAIGTTVQVRFKGLDFRTGVYATITGTTPLISIEWE